MELSKKEIGILQRIVGSDGLELLQIIANALLVQLAQNPVDEETSFLTAKECIKREERKKIMTNFFKTIEELSHGER